MEDDKIKIGVLKKKAVTVEESVVDVIELNYPKDHKYYKMHDDGVFFARGIVLLAIIKKSPSSFLLFEVERGKQFYTDFVPTKDCRQEDFIDSKNSIRRIALDVMIGGYTPFDEITEAEFLSERIDLLNAPLQDIIKTHP